MSHNSQKIGIMGGTFNPIHYGHLMIAEDARIFCQLDEVIFIPSGNSYMKDADEILDGRLRLAMTELAVCDNIHFSCSDTEINRMGNTYTYETLEELQRMYPEAELYFILGADNLFSVEKWKYASKVLQGCTLIAASRGEKSREQLQKQADFLTEAYQARIILLPERKMDISSTEIRERIRSHQSVRYLTPEGVYNFIKANQLYVNE